MTTTPSATRSHDTATNCVRSHCQSRCIPPGSSHASIAINSTPSVSYNDLNRCDQCHGLSLTWLAHKPKQGFDITTARRTGRLLILGCLARECWPVTTAKPAKPSHQLHCPVLQYRLLGTRQLSVQRG